MLIFFKWRSLFTFELDLQRELTAERNLCIYSSFPYFEIENSFNATKYYVVYVTSTCWLVTFLTLLRDVAKRQFQNMQNIHLDEKCISEANS